MKVGCLDMQLEVEVMIDEKGEITDVLSNSVSIKNALKKSQILWIKQELSTECIHENLKELEEDVICRACGEHSNTEECEDCGEEFGTSCCNSPGRF